MTTFIKDIPIETKTKEKIKGCVKAYVELFPEENALVIKYIKDKKWFLEDREFGEAKVSGVITRTLFEIPENLEAIIIKALTEQELVEFRGLKGSRWFAKTFPQFRTADEV